MKILKTISIGLTAALVLSACSNNSSMMDDLNSTGNSIVRFANGTFSAQLYNTNVKSVYDATELAINNTNNYNIESNTITERNAKIKGFIKTEKSMFDKEGKTPYSIEITKYDNSTVNIYIKIGAVGDKQSSVDLLSSIRTNLGL
jgi:hypothetical protein